MTSREEFRKYRSAAHKQEINIHGGTYSDVPGLFSNASAFCAKTTSDAGRVRINKISSVEFPVDIPTDLAGICVAFLLPCKCDDLVYSCALTDCLLKVSIPGPESIKIFDDLSMKQFCPDATYQRISRGILS